MSRIFSICRGFDVLGFSMRQGFRCVRVSDVHWVLCRFILCVVILNRGLSGFLMCVVFYAHNYFNVWDFRVQGFSMC